MNANWHDTRGMLKATYAALFRLSGVFSLDDIIGAFHKRINLTIRYVAI